MFYTKDSSNLEECGGGKKMNGTLFSYWSWDGFNKLEERNQTKAAISVLDRRKTPENKPGTRFWKELWPYPSWERWEKRIEPYFT